MSTRAMVFPPVRALRGADVVFTHSGRRRCRVTEVAISDRLGRFAERHRGIVACRVAIEASSEEPSSPCYLRLGVVIDGDPFIVCAHVTLDGSASSAAFAADGALGELERRLARRARR